MDHAYSSNTNRVTSYVLHLNMMNVFSALTLLVGQREGHPACKNWVVGCCLSRVVPVKGLLTGVCVYDAHHAVSDDYWSNYRKIKTLGGIDDDSFQTEVVRERSKLCQMSKLYRLINLGNLNQTTRTEHSTAPSQLYKHNFIHRHETYKICTLLVLRFNITLCWVYIW